MISLSFSLSSPKPLFHIKNSKNTTTYHVGQDPAGDPDSINDLRRELPPASRAPRVEEPTTAGEGDTGGVVGQVGVVDEADVGEQARGEDAPQAVPGVDGHGVERVVELDFNGNLGRKQVKAAGDGADDDGGPGPDDVARSRDGGQAGEAPVAHVLDAVHGLARRDLGLDRADNERGEPGGGRGQSGGDGGVGNGEVVGGTGDRLLRPRVEAVPVFFCVFLEGNGGESEGVRKKKKGKKRKEEEEKLRKMKQKRRRKTIEKRLKKYSPSKPEDHDSQDEKARVVPGHRDDGAVGEEAADAGPDDEGSGGGGEA